MAAIDTPVQVDYRPTSSHGTVARTITKPLSRTDAEARAVAYAKSAAVIAAGIAASESAAASKATTAPVSATVSSASSPVPVSVPVSTVGTPASTSGSATQKPASKNEAPTASSGPKPDVYRRPFFGRRREGSYGKQANHHGVVFPYGFEPEMPDPHTKPVDFARWMDMALSDMLAKKDSLIPKKAAELFDDKMGPDKYTNFGLRPVMKFINLTRAGNVESLIMTICGIEAERPW
ncbi:hypothetical protein Sste5346_002498 [Sporothrix stenoceras]|uniref:Uncharacterized protein n=1 Tax=Sporothrix stenoceras TaxID=5173 RepID=A0ABR3ZHK4_9PEZI